MRVAFFDSRPSSFGVVALITEFSPFATAGRVEDVDRIEAAFAIAGPGACQRVDLVNKKDRLFRLTMSSRDAMRYSKLPR